MMFQFLSQSFFCVVGLLIRILRVVGAFLLLALALFWDVYNWAGGFRWDWATG